MLKIVYYTALWCGPCQSFKPVVERLRDEMGFELEYRDVETIEDDHIRIMSIPTLVFFIDGKQVRVMSGAYPEDKVRATIRGLTSGAR